MENKELPFLSNYGFMLTYKCSVACPHCIVKAGPHRKEEMKAEDAFNWLEQIHTYSRESGFTPGIALTGGEPSFNRELLKKVADYAATLNFIVSVVTNACWADTRESALEFVGDLSSVQLFSLSTDIYHQKFIPLSNIRNAVYACKKLGRQYNIAVATPSEQDHFYLALMDELLEFTEAEKIDTAMIVKVGRAENAIDGTFLDGTPEPSEGICTMASFPILFPNGKVIACIGPPIVLPETNPLYLGNLKNEPLKDIVERAEINPVLHAIRAFGPSLLVSKLQESGYGHLLPATYREDTICDICHQLFSDGEICRALESIGQEDYFRRKVAYGRLYYLNEISMMERMNLVETN
jgi:MoaA/NifB/PqqE/SkfB family radical SAM enzyme